MARNLPKVKRFQRSCLLRDGQGHVVRSAFGRSNNLVFNLLNQHTLATDEQDLTLMRAYRAEELADFTPVV
jgi:hypothetical protein